MTTLRVYVAADGRVAEVLIQESAAIPTSMARPPRP